MNEWIDWNGGECPVNEGSIVEVLLRNGELRQRYAAPLRWDHESIHYKEYDIVRYRVVEETKAEAIETKDINPKNSNGLAKLPLNLWPGLATAYGCIGLMNGGMRYGYGNYKATPVSMSIYLAAILRHTYALIEGQEFDEVDGSPHIGAILANCAIIVEARAVGTLVDDRPLTGGYLKEAEELTKHVARFQEMYKDRTPRHYTIKDNKEE